ncbi:hypothetical protein K2173_013976 [Erythroxylum novogranatense]|uniref:DUF7950 domain-containing protein n=1 Tax=Erythroxylum novogranatense TaxID=1862640 RepID=A0AAV8SDF5_9ROSI|nr:hypothetical protein K2173_013976 [Erythroxylum novogranatense]
MDGRETWPVLTCTAHHGQDKTIINRIMLGFRPIAPKPATGDPSSTVRNPENKNSLLSRGRVKRKYVRVKKNNEQYKRRKKMAAPSSDREEMTEDDQSKKILTLELFRDKTDLAQGSPSDTGTTVVEGTVSKDPPILFDFMKEVVGGFVASDPKMTSVEKRVLETTVTVEYVTDPCMDSVASLRCTDLERIRHLETDTCPGFISDGSNAVRWINEAYKNMMVGRTYDMKDEASPSPEIRVGLVIKEKLAPSLSWSSTFTCWVSLQKDKWSTLMVPCDVWRMEFGGLAWRLDVRAALGLGI